MREEELKQMDKEQLLGIVKAQKFEIERLNKECDTYMKIATKKENVIKEVRHWVKVTIDIIKQQPTGNDEWILERLNVFLKILDKVD